jgi:hypothetical protein
MRAKQLGGTVKYLSQGEIDARNRGYSPYSTETWRAWEYWANKAGCGHMLTRPDDKRDRPSQELKGLRDLLSLHSVSRPRPRPNGC